MKKKIIFCILLCMALWGMTGCGKASEEADRSAAQQTEKREADGTATQETQKTDHFTAQGAEDSSTGSTDRVIILSDADPTEEYVKYNIEDYGTIEEKRQEYQEHESERIAYYYEMENFFLNDTLPNGDAINRTLQEIYDGHEKRYQQGAEAYQYGMSGADTEEFPTEYDFWQMLSLTYIGDDYVSLQYNDVSYIGGAHPYSYYEGITIDVKTGEQVEASQLLGKGDDEILAEVSREMGLDVIGTWDDLDFYLTDSYIVFFYRYPGFWDDVVLSRQ
ncbi:MAG: hypothetical protein NC094_01270 [Bacteroidales bacterium]|nr:hypothetical protein [Lachnoclostridium sp.]MCM1384479.1 hypothetical protein [Lachnoclostridium sp.]MCM1464024.1 hypothetical protein [Bacteroidales bacterium]